jgi:diguanylate cyclase (GGDEF)-like protein
VNQWSNYHLGEFFAAVCAVQDEQSAVMTAVERATEALEAEIGGVLRDGRVENAWGTDLDRLEALFADGSRPALIDVPGVGKLHVAVAGFGTEYGGALMVARAGDPLAPEERQLLQAMAQSVGLTLHNIMLLSAERRLREEREREAAERLALLESLHAARHDSLTALPTRVLFLEVLEEKLSGASPVSILFIDLDRFKAVNDSLGHAAGDELLGHVAARIRGCLRPCDVGARLGGDEFAVLLDDTTAEEAVPVAWRLIESIRMPFRITGKDVFVGASIGVATCHDGSDPAELLGNADVAMYRAKKDGPGKVAVFAPQMHAEALAHLTMSGDLQRALALGEFRVQYQPLIRLATGAIAGVEALVRWHRPDGTRALPEDFLPTAEENGLIADIGSWVLHTAGRQAALWRRTMPELTLSLNVSGRQLTDPRFAVEVERMLSRSGLPPALVTLEFAESVLMSDPTTAVACLADLKDLGVAVAIDDFGVGQSSLSYLQRLPVDEIKIDQAFVRRREPGARDVAVVRALVGLARRLGLRTVVEGIETEGQRLAMRRLGCELGQGHHLARPVYAEELFTPLAA